MTRMGSIHWACGLLELGVQTSLGNWTQKGCKRQPVNQETVLCLELSEWTLLCLWHHGDNQSNSPYNSSKNICWPTQGHSVCLLLAPYCVCLSPFSNLGRVEELPRIKKLRHSNTVAADDRAIIWGFFFSFSYPFLFWWACKLLFAYLCYWGLYCYKYGDAGSFLIYRFHICWIYSQNWNCWVIG